MPGARLSPRQFAQRLRSIDVRAAVARAIRSERPEATKGIKRDLRSRGVTGALHRKRKLRLARIIRARVSTSGRGVRLRVSLRGLAALEVLGGRTKRHDITPNRARALGPFPRGGFAAHVDHPGSRLKKIDHFAPLRARLKKETPTAVQGELHKALSKGIG